jgi:hypothetical protein
VIGANPAVDQLKFGNGHASWSGLLVSASLPLFLVFLRRLARYLERPDLEKRARFLLKLLAWCVPLLGMLGVGFFFQVFPMVEFVWYTPIVISGALLLGLVFLLLLVRSFKLIRGLQVEITRRL